MNPTPEQVAAWALEAGITEHDAYPKPLWVGHDFNLQRFATLVAAWKAEQDAVTCDDASEQWATVAKDSRGCDGRYDFKSDAAADCAAEIRADAPKVTT